MSDTPAIETAEMAKVSGFGKECSCTCGIENPDTGIVEQTKIEFTIPSNPDVDMSDVAGHYMPCTTKDKADQKLHDNIIYCRNGTPAKATGSCKTGSSNANFKSTCEAITKEERCKMSYELAGDCVE